MNKKISSKTENEKIKGADSKPLRNLKLLAMIGYANLPHKAQGKDLLIEKVLDHEKVVDFINLQNLGWKAAKYENLENFTLGRTMGEVQKTFFRRKKRSKPRSANLMTS